MEMEEEKADQLRGETFCEIQTLPLVNKDF